ncbi:MAG TPA: 6-phosphogluconolactonase [Patescibacteria group bacterium]|nr:6-phosphogluconolactonase [Patescibacteria group bacterium]
MTTIEFERVAIRSLPLSEGVPLGFWEGRVQEVDHPELKNIYVLPDRTEAARFAAEKILEVIREKPDAAISFPTGKQALSVYTELGKLAKDRGVSFSNVTAFHLDEYFPINPDHPDSFRKYLRENVWGPLGIKPENVHEIQADPGSDGNAVASAYEALLATHDIDLVLHPIGCGGHMGFNEKGTPQDSLTHLAPLAPETVYRDQVERGQTSPDHAITQGISTILRAKKILFIDLDPNYQNDVKEALFGPIGDHNPSSFLRTAGEKVEAIMTKEIAAHVLA